jgi:hypothetical protein
VTINPIYKKTNGENPLVFFIAIFSSFREMPL